MNLRLSEVHRYGLWLRHPQHLLINRSALAPRKLHLNLRHALRHIQHKHLLPFGVPTLAVLGQRVEDGVVVGEGDEQVVERRETPLLDN